MIVLTSRWLSHNLIAVCSMRIVDSDVLRWAGVGDLRVRLAAIFGDGKMLVGDQGR